LPPPPRAWASLNWISCWPMKVEPRLRVVIDTNVWISAALLPGSLPGQVVRRVLAQGVPVFSPATFEALRSRLWKPKFDRWVSLEMRQQWLHDADACALWVTPSANIAAQAYSRDRDDDAFIHAALAAEAGFLVTGDQDLLVVGQALPFLILTPAEALAQPALAALAG
jgi:uncharacterized protein